MDTHTVKKTVREIASLAHDPDAAHGREDKLFAAVLKAIAEGAPNASELAAAALKSKEIRFSRWTG